MVLGSGLISVGGGGGLMEWGSGGSWRVGEGSVGCFSVVKL